MPTPRNRLAPSPIEDNPVGWSSIYPPPPGRVIENASPEFSPLAPSTYMTAAQKVGRFFNAATGRAKPYTVADLLGLTQAGNEAYDAAAGFVNSTNPIRAYHGSPHTFDRFDMSKIGTGEGAQAYGHGLYFAGNEGVARSYRDVLTRDAGNTTVWRDAAGKTYDLDKMRFLAEKGDPQGFAASFLGQAASVDDAINYVTKYGAGAFPGGKPQYEATLGALEQMKNAGVAKVPGGSMYEVSLRTTPERLLDWDKPLSQQPAAVREAINPEAMGLKWVPKFPESKYGGYIDQTGKPISPLFSGPNGMPLDPAQGAAKWLDSVGGQQAHAMLLKQGETPAGLAARLRDAGIDGIQYLDAGSRAAGEGSRNYVMFRDDIIDVLKRYGLLGMIGGGAAAGNRLAPQGEQ